MSETDRSADAAAARPGIDSAVDAAARAMAEWQGVDYYHAPQIQVLEQLRAYFEDVSQVDRSETED